MGMRVLVVLLGLMLISLSPNPGTAQKDHGDTPIRGITISCNRSGPGEWDSPALMNPTLDDAVGVGANWVTIHPYFWLGGGGQLRYDPERQDASVSVTTRLAHERGLKVLLKPHVGYWGSPFGWRGEITYDNEADWKRFFDSYTKWIVHQARLAAEHQVDAFCIGLEYQGTHHREADWRRVIAAVRAVYDGPLTYGANWDGWQQVPFWDALDVVGIVAYFPISDVPDPTDDQLREGWQKLLTSLRVDPARQGKPICLVELGYPRALTAAAKPWDYHDDGPKAGAIRDRAIRIALEMIETEPTLVGSFLWKWFPDDRESGHDFVLQTPESKAAIRAVWREPNAP